MKVTDGSLAIIVVQRLVGHPMPPACSSGWALLACRLRGALASSDHYIWPTDAETA